jgi:hypothetical protein
MVKIVHPSEYYSTPYWHLFLIMAGGDVDEIEQSLVFSKHLAQL